jgi:polysaccharide biosynthesis/export protein
MRFQPSILVWCILSVVLVGCRTYGPQFDPRRSSKSVKLDEPSFISVVLTNQIRPEWLRPPSDFFRLGPGDTVEIEYVGELTSRSPAVVGPDGKIYYSLLPGVFVWGLTLAETKDLLEKELAKYMRVKPDLVLNLQAVGSKSVWILGAVQSPGVYPLAAPMTLLEAISLAGGTLNLLGSSEEIADLGTSFVMRGSQLLKVDFYKLLRQGDLSQNIYLQPDDLVDLRPAVARNVYVLGAVTQPNVVGFSEQISLVSAIASSGGTIEYAHVSQVAIVRGSLVNPKIALVDYKAILGGRAVDVRLEPGDIVYVPFVPYKKLAQFVEQLLNQFVSTVAINAGNRAVLPSSRPVTVSVPFAQP